MALTDHFDFLPEQGMRRCIVCQVPLGANEGVPIQLGGGIALLIHPDCVDHLNVAFTRQEAEAIQHIHKAQPGTRINKAWKQG